MYNYWPDALGLELGIGLGPEKNVPPLLPQGKPCLPEILTLLAF